jgi:hypothetical protein
MNFGQIVFIIPMGVFILITLNNLFRKKIAQVGFFGRKFVHGKLAVVVNVLLVLWSILFIMGIAFQIPEFWILSALGFLFTDIGAQFFATKSPSTD